MDAIVQNKQWMIGDLRARHLTGWDELGDGLEMRVYEDLIKTKEGYFGDWELIRM